MAVMQKWQWEVCKMFMYMAFPVGCFHYFNSPQIFEEEITKIKLETYTATPKEKREQIENMITDINSKRQNEILDEMQAKK